MVSKINYRLAVLRPVLAIANIRTKLILVNSLIISIFKYACPLLIDSSLTQLNKMQTLLMKVSRHVIGFNTYKLSTINIMKLNKWITFHHMVIKETILFIHKIMFENIPRSITQFYSYSMSNNLNIRMVRKASIKIQHKSNIATKSLLY